MNFKPALANRQLQVYQGFLQFLVFLAVGERNPPSPLYEREVIG